jgi:hypothetical protein
MEADTVSGELAERVDGDWECWCGIVCGRLQVEG